MNLLPAAGAAGRLPAVPGLTTTEVVFVTDLGQRLSRSLQDVLACHHRAAAQPEGSDEHLRQVRDLTLEVADLVADLERLPAKLLAPAERAEVDAVLGTLPLVRDARRAEERLGRALSEFAVLWAPARLGESTFKARWLGEAGPDAERTGIEHFAAVFAGADAVAGETVTAARAQALLALARQLLAYRWPWRAVLAAAPDDAPLSARQVLAAFVGAAAQEAGEGESLASVLEGLPPAERSAACRLWAAHEPCLRALVGRGFPLAQLDLVAPLTGPEQIAVTGNADARQWLALSEGPLTIVRDGGVGIVGDHLPLQPIAVRMVGAVDGYGERLVGAVERHTEPNFAVRRLPGQHGQEGDLRYFSGLNGLYLPLRLVAAATPDAAAYLLRIDEAMLDGSEAAGARLAKLDDALGVELFHRRTIGGRGPGAPLVFVVASAEAKRLANEERLCREVVPAALRWPLLFVPLSAERGAAPGPLPRSRFQAAVEWHAANNRSRRQQSLIHAACEAFPRVLDEALAGGCTVQILLEGESLLEPLGWLARQLTPRFRAAALPFLRQRRADSDRTAVMVESLLRQVFELPLQQARISLRQGEIGLRLATAGAWRGRWLKASLDRANLAAERLEAGAKTAVARAGQLLGIELAGEDLAADADRCRRELDAVRQRLQWLAGI